MQFALNNGHREQPRPGARGVCPMCGHSMVAKCGSKVIWHWAHHGRQRCDPWWENETPWHRAWKSCFPGAWQEVVHHDPQTGEKHIADVKTPEGLVFEFQNSPMPSAELRAREHFYGRMVWIVNAARFEDNFRIVEAPAPSPDAEFVRDLVPNVMGVATPNPSWAFFRRSEAPDYDFDNPPEPGPVEVLDCGVRIRPGRLFLVHDWKEIEDDVMANYEGHHFFFWKRPRTVWFEATAPVYLDFGSSVLWQLGVYDARGLRFVKWTHKRQLIEAHGGIWSPDDDEIESMRDPLDDNLAIDDEGVDIPF